MKTETRNTEEAQALWAYVHDELDQAARAAFEQRLAADSGLRERQAHACRLDQVLRAALPTLDLDVADASDDRLTEQALAVWERDQAAAAGPQPAQSHLPSPRRLRFFFTPAAAGFAGLAAAALLVVTFLPALRAPPEARWCRPEFSPLTFRGSEAALRTTALDTKTAHQAQAALESALARAAAGRGGALPAGLTLSLHLSERRDGAFSVSVRARSSDGRALGDWNGDYSSLARFLAHVDASAARLADALAEPAGEAGMHRVRPKE